MMRDLDGLRVLVVEDELMVATVVEDMLRAAGCTLIGPIARLAEATTLAREAEIDVALLDVNLVGGRVFAVADALIARNVPFVFMTGYGGASLPAPYAGRPTLSKPFDRDGLLTLLATTAGDA